MPGEELVGKVIRNRARPGFGPAIPDETEGAKAGAHGAGVAKVEFKGGLARQAGRRSGVFGPDPAGGTAGPVLLADGLLGASGELEVEVALEAVGGGGEPALQVRTQADEANLGGEALGQAQPGGAQARKEAGVGEGRDG